MINCVGSKPINQPDKPLGLMCDSNSYGSAWEFIHVVSHQRIPKLVAKRSLLFPPFFLLNAIIVLLMVVALTNPREKHL